MQADATSATTHAISRLSWLGWQSDAHALLVAIYRDESLPLSRRLDAPKSAVKFERLARAATMVMQKNALDELSLDDLQRLDAKSGLADLCSVTGPTQVTRSAATYR